MLRRIFERRHERLLAPIAFFFRLLRNAFIAAVLVFVALAIGVLGYHHLEGLSWLDSLLDASMILGGMGPVHPIQTDAGKLFASFYALFSGIVFLTMATLLVAPVYHRLLHMLHLEVEEEEHKQQPSQSDVQEPRRRP